jgi:hypothetical protein
VSPTRPAPWGPCNGGGAGFDGGAATYVGYQLVFTGSATGLLGNWLKWLFLSIITIGI